MADFISNNGINVTPRPAGGIGGQRPGTRGRTTDSAKAKRAKAHINFIPDEEALEDLIEQAVHAFSRGTAWDRGSILNLLV